MSNLTRAAAVGLLLLCASLGGCSTTDARPDERQFTSRDLPTVDPDKAYRVANALVRREFGRVTGSAESRRLTSEPSEYTASAGSGSARDLVGGRSGMRRDCKVSVSPRGQGSVARFRVDVYRRDTAKRDLLLPENNRLSDNPSSATPIERDAALSRRQSEVWTYVRRDYTLENALLDELVDQCERDRPAARDASREATLEPAADRSDRATLEKSAGQDPSPRSEP